MIECYLIIANIKGGPKVRRVTTKRPALAANEAAIRLQVDLPPNAFSFPLVTVPVTRGQIAVAIEAQEPSGE